MRVSVIGLGKLGAPMLAVFASHGHRVVGVDKNEETVRKINARVAPVEEPGLGMLLRERDYTRYTSDFSATTSIRDAVLDTEMTFIIVPTPSRQDGSYDTDLVAIAAAEIGAALKEKEERHIVVLTSTVLPGDTNRIQKILEAKSGKYAGDGFGLCYNPEFIALGSVIRDLNNPDFILIGESDYLSGNKLTVFYDAFHFARPVPYQRMKIVEAELVKIAVNTFITTKISYANFLGAICAEIGADVDIVNAAVGRDSRIGNKYLRSGGPYGGPCFPRDNRALAYVAKTVSVHPYIPIATDMVNDQTLNRILGTILANSTRDKLSVGILGMAYKPETGVTDESLGTKLVSLLGKTNITVRTGGPGEGTNFVLGSDIIVFANPCKEFQKLIARWEDKIVLDPWGQFSEYEKVAKKYYSFGRGGK
jgi:UDPglucose 6-dehydrogenase